MAAKFWVYRLSDGVFLTGRGGFNEQPFDLATEGVAAFTDDAEPDVIAERFDATSPTLRRPATQVEIDTYRNEQRDREIDELKALRALARASYELKTNLWTQQQFFDRIKAIYRAL